MANKKFSDFTLKTDPANVDFLVGYLGSDNVRIDPANLSSGMTSFTLSANSGTTQTIEDGNTLSILGCVKSSYRLIYCNNKCPLFMSK